MQTSLRTIRNHIQDHDHAPVELTTRQRETRDRALRLAESVIAAFGVVTLTFSTLAAAMRISPATLRFHFADLDALLSALLVRHQDALVAALCEIPNDDPDCHANRRAAYLAATRRPCGSLIDAHLLLVRDRHFLPADELTLIEAQRHQIGILLAGDRAQLALDLLDSPFAEATEIETMLAALAPAGYQRPRGQAAAADLVRPAARVEFAEKIFVPNKQFIPPQSYFDQRNHHEPIPLAETEPLLPTALDVDSFRKAKGLCPLDPHRRAAGGEI